MDREIENTVRREQVKLLRFEKFLRQIAPIAIATGLTAAGMQSAQAQLATLGNAKNVFAALEKDDLTSQVLFQAESSLTILFSKLSESASLDTRQLAMINVMETVDTAHQAAQAASHRTQIRLVGEKTLGKRVEGGTPKISDNASWLKSAFGL